MKWACENGYIEQFIPSYRGTIGDRFCRAVRNGNEDVRSILDAVREDVERRDGAVWKQVTETLETVEAWEFAEHILERECLPYDEYVALKNEAKSNGVRVAMEKDAPTEKQLKYLKGLGCSDVPKTKLEASDLISNFKASRVLPRGDMDNCPF